PAEEIENSLEVGLAFLYRAADWFCGVAEVNTEVPLTGDETGHVVVNVTPGVKFKPIRTYQWELGLGISLPVSENREFEYNVIVSSFLHF
ncbi:MAG TPA: hypothetical protein VL860_14150, partial [Planctomycetota bacterium]|nr:hypothetical protein [Planctomycetota bacterium]